MKKTTLFFFIVLLFFSKTALSYPLKPTNKNFLKPYCQGSTDFENFTLMKVPQKIDIETIDVRKWYINLFRAIKSLGIRFERSKGSKRIDRETKKFHSAKLTAYYENGIKCIFKAKIRIHGSAGDHISYSKFVTSMRVNLIDGNILHRSQFILFLPQTRGDDNEVFITTLLKEFNLLAPLTFPITVKVNENEPVKFLFQEKIAGILLSTNNRRNGIIMAANKNSQIIEAMNAESKPRKYSLNLGRVIWGENLGNKVIIKALDKLNYLYLQTLGYGNGIKMSGQEILKRDTTFLQLKKDYFQEDLTGFENISVFDAIMVATGGHHGLTTEDRRFYYDAVYDRLEPIYYDGGNKILNKNYKLIIHGAYNHYKLGAEKAKEYIDKLNILKFQKNLKLRGLNIDIKEINSILNRITNNLDIIMNTELVELESPYAKKYYSEHIDREDINFKLAFNGKNNIFQLCNVLLDDCVKEKFDGFEAINIFKEQITKINGKKILYVRKSLENYINNSPPKNYGIVRMKKFNLGPESEIFINNSITVDINNDTKIVKFTMIDDSGRAVVKGKKINDWAFSLQGVSQNFIEKNTKSSLHGVDPQGCITFIDSEIKEISIYTQDTTCPNSIHFIRTKGTINKIKMRNATWDAFDADFSNLEIKNIDIKNTGHHCIGLKGGKYKIVNANVEKCEDKGVSSSEFSEVTIEKINITDSHVGLASKDSGIIIAKKTNIENTDLCLLSYRNKIEYQGSYIGTYKNNYFCESKNYFMQTGSKWENFN